MAHRMDAPFYLCEKTDTHRRSLFANNGSAVAGLIIALLKSGTAVEQLTMTMLASKTAKTPPSGTIAKLAIDLYRL